MVDILGGLASETPTSSFLAFKAHDLKRYVGEEQIDFNYLQVDPATFLSGWGKYDSAARQFVFEWDDAFGKPKQRPAEDFKRSFSCWVFPDTAKRPLLWQRFSYGESTGFNSLLDTFWHDKEGKEGLPVVEFMGAKHIQVGAGKSAEMHWSLAKWSQRNPDFIIPEWADNVDVGNQETHKGLTDDDIPF